MPAGVGAVGVRRYVALQLDNELAGSNLSPEARQEVQTLLDVSPLAFAHYLYERDIATFNPRNVIQTHMLQEQATMSMTPLMKWWIDCLNNGMVSPHDEFGTAVSKDLLFDEFKRVSNDKYSIKQTFFSLHRVPQDQICRLKG